MADLYELLGGSTPENNLAEEYAGVLDLFGRFAGGVEDGNLRYAWEKAAEVRRYLERFERRIQETEAATDGGEPFVRFTGGDLDGQKVATAAVALGQAYRAGKLLHPVDQIKDEAVKAEVQAREERTQAFRDELGG
ncbi:hypothetical protein [Streptomyces sp. NBC_01483]|uniref:hypothetical protein n=1 Tax=Streptomyces sp. NBC_01483 TaxID=2903883 RepID=UPI002E30161F|nr:hypothetical protein [Streptomyces sp. NBC_01483]